MTNDSTSPVSEAVELLPCPFCGGEAERMDLEDGDNAGGAAICCTRCLASGNVEFGRKENYVSNWNRRVTPPPPPQDERPPIVAGDDLIAQIGKLLADDPACGGRVTTYTIERIAALSTPVSRPAADLDELRRQLGRIRGEVKATRGYEPNASVSIKLGMIDGYLDEAFAALGIAFEDE